MRTPLILLKIIAKAALHTFGIGGAWTILVEDVPELANNVWTAWNARTATQRRADLEAVAMLDDNVRPDIEAIVAEVAADQPATVREELAAYLAQVPASVRQTLRRPADPTGQTVPPSLEPRSGQDLIPFLAAQRPRFHKNDRPIPGADWVVDELLGIGGYGEVWKARHIHIDDFPPVALKFCIDPQARERLLKHEARICARVQREGKHPGIVELQHTYLSADPPCLQYEYIDGGTLANVIKDFAGRETPPSPEEVTRLLLVIAKPVAFAHRLVPPIVHRDLKPANILLQGANGSTRVKIADFGIGGIATAAVIRATRQPTHPGLLLTKAVSGSHSPLYASPEQAAGGDSDTRDDVHALGVIWYQMLTGRLTAGPTGGAAWRKKLAARGMSPALLELLDSCLDEATERIADAAVLCERIEAALSLEEANRPSSEIPAVAFSTPTDLATSSPIPIEDFYTTGTDLRADLEKLRCEYQRDLPATKPEAKIGELARFEGHEMMVRCVAFAPDGRSALCGGLAARLWDVATGREIRRFKGHKDMVWGVAFAPDGRSALSGSDDKTVRLWDVATGREIRRFKGHKDEVRSVAFAPDGRSALSGSEDGTVRLWDVATGREIRRFKEHTGLRAVFEPFVGHGDGNGIWGLAFAPDGRSALSDCRDTLIRLWDVATGREIRRFEGHVGPVWSVAFAPDGRSAISGGHEAQLWDVATGREIRRFKGHKGSVTGVTFSPDGRSALSGSDDKTVRLWDVATGREIHRFEGHEGSVWGVAFAPDGRSALSGSDDKTVRLWGLPAS